MHQVAFPPCRPFSRRTCRCRATCTSARPLKRGRTRRRRASRAMAKRHHSRAPALRRRGASNVSIQLRKDASIKENMERIVASYRLGDGMSKNCVVMKCAYCGTKKKRKALEATSDQKVGQKRKAPGAADGGPAAGKSGRVLQPESTARKRIIASPIRDNTDFISLGGPAGGRKVQKQQHSGKRRQDETKGSAFPLLGGK